MNLNLNDPNNSIATFFGLMGDGTSRIFDLVVTTVLSVVIAVVIHDQLSEEAKTSILGLTLTFSPALVFFYWFYRRADADNRIRRAFKKAPGNMTVQQVREALTVQDIK